jgi:hypothetical protein
VSDIKGKEAKPSRLNIVMSADDRARLDRIANMMGGATATDVTKDALRLLEFVATKISQGSNLYIQDRGEAPAKLEILGVTTP